MDQECDLYFVEDKSHKGFCSEECIESFYAFLVAYFENQEKEVRKKLSLSISEGDYLVEDINLVEKSIARPCEIYIFDNSFGEDVYAFHYEYQPTDIDERKWIIILCLVYERRPSFIFLVMASKCEEFREYFRSEDKIDNIDEFLTESSGENQSDQEDELISLSEDLLAMIEQKKSAMLADLLNKRSPADIPFENFHLYDQFTPSTLGSPDEVYRYRDDVGDEVLTYIKAHDKKGVSFFYFVLCLNLEQKMNDGKKGILPILSFPSLDGDLTFDYRHGEKVSGKLQN